jgi:hypothetical protein
LADADLDMAKTILASVDIVRALIALFDGVISSLLTCHPIAENADDLDALVGALGLKAA